MSGVQPPSDCTAYLRHLREYVLEPVTTAVSTARREQTEVRAERTALEEFADRVDALTPSRDRCSDQTLQRPIGTGSPDTIREVRAAYRNTMMNVPHYEDEYGESLLENLGEELGAELAAALHPETNTRLTPFLQNSLVESARRQAANRDEMLTVVQRELRSLRTAKSWLDELVEQAVERGVPVCSCSDEATELRELAESRQRVLRERPSLEMSRITDLCSYLYASEPWTYPVLVSVSRFREAAIT